MEINSDLATCNMAKGLVHLMNREFLDAIAEGRRAVERLPNNDEAATCLGLYSAGIRPL